MSYDYVWGLFYEAVQTLVKNPEATAVRLRSAYLGSLFKLQEADLDPDLWLRFLDLRLRLRVHRGKDGAGAVEETTSRMGQDEAEEATESILSIYADLTARYGIPEEYERLPDLRRDEEE